MRNPIEVPSNKYIERDLRQQFKKWSMIEENVIPYKSKVQRLKLGDANAIYFFAQLKNRIAQNIITSLLTKECVKVKTQYVMIQTLS